MKPVICSLLTCTLLLLNSCLNVFQPLITPDKNVQDKRLEGDWKWGELKINIIEYSKAPIANQKIMDFGRNENSSAKDIQDSINLYHKSYILSFSDTSYTYYYHLQMTTKKATHFVQLTPIIHVNVVSGSQQFDENNVPDSRFNSFGKEGIMSTFSFGRLNFVGNTRMEIQFLDGDKLKALILNGQFKTRYAFDRLYDNFLITADSDELDKIIDKYGNNDNLYSIRNNFQLIKTN